jgi:hypothetical protein
MSHICRRITHITPVTHRSLLACQQRRCWTPSLEQRAAAGAFVCPVHASATRRVCGRARAATNHTTARRSSSTPSCTACLPTRTAAHTRRRRPAVCRARACARAHAMHASCARARMQASCAARAGPVGQRLLGPVSRLFDQPAAAGGGRVRRLRRHGRRERPQHGAGGVCVCVCVCVCLSGRVGEGAGVQELQQVCASGLLVQTCMPTSVS